jgi:dihydroorotate dehydrogenase electron transfer subunit
MWTGWSSSTRERSRGSGPGETPTRRQVPRGNAVTLLETGRVVQASEIGQLGTLLVIRSPEISLRAHAGQFVHVRAGTGFESLLRRPYSFCRIDRDAGEIELIVKPLGAGGEWIASRRPGDALDLLGPLGTSFVVHRATRNLLLVAGGTGIAPLRVLAEQEDDRRNVTLVMGGRSIQHLWPSGRLPAGVEYLTTTEDGSFGRSGRVTDVLPEVLPWADQVLACGPWPMLAALGRMREALSREPAVSPGRAALLAAQIALEQHMGCAMGVCRACVIVTARGNERVCREGPVFDLGEVLFEEGEPATVGAS